MKSNKDILVIDDEQVILDAVTRICRAEGWDVDTVLRAGDALKKMKSNNYSLILCDIMMPEIDGFGFINMLLTQKNDTPVIMITGYSTIENTVESLHNGAIDFIPKPFTFEEITSSVKRGLAFNKIKSSISKSGTKNDTKQMYVLTCPPGYKRLGYGSWVKLEKEGTAIVGATDLFIKTIEGLAKINLLAEEDSLIQGTACAQIITTDNLTHNFLTPVSGRIIRSNELLEENPELLQKDPFVSGWLYKIIPSDIDYEAKYLVSCSTTEN